MQKLNKKTITKPVGVLSVRNTHEKDPIAPSKNHKGITLIALIITIIVMIILVGVTVNVALNGGLFKVAQDAAENTIAERDRELDLSEGEIIDEWVNGGPITLPEGWEEIAKPEEWNNDNIIAVTDGTNTIPLPQGYEISNKEGEHTIEEGVVIKDSKGNEFVWIPVSEDFTYQYESKVSLESYSEPTELTNNNYLPSGAPFDSQETLDYFYGTKEDGSTPYYNYEIDFAYDEHYAEMVESVNKYHGFYIGRYETTIDESNEIGSKYNEIVLTTDKTIPQTNNKQVGWYGLYYIERNSNVAGNKEYIQTNMIWGQEWDAMIEYFDSKSLEYSAFDQTQGEVINSGQSTNSSNEKDKTYNIYDLRTNCYDWTAEASFSSNSRVVRGGSYYDGCSVSNRYSDSPSVSNSHDSSRLTLYIK